MGRSMDATEREGWLSRALNRLGHVEPGESRAVGSAFLLFFFVLGGYFAVRPVRETFATVIGRDAVATNASSARASSAPVANRSAGLTQAQYVFGRGRR